MYALVRVWATVWILFVEEGICRSRARTHGSDFQNTVYNQTTHPSIAFLCLALVPCSFTLLFILVKRRGREKWRKTNRKEISRGLWHPTIIPALMSDLNKQFMKLCHTFWTQISGRNRNNIAPSLPDLTAFCKKKKKKSVMVGYNFISRP